MPGTSELEVVISLREICHRPTGSPTLRTVFERIADHPINQVDQLLPWHIQPASPTEIRLAA